MPALKLAAFSGEQPRIIPRLLQPNSAVSALNARLDDGSLTPYRESSFVDNLTALWQIGSNLRENGTAIGDLTGGGNLAAAFDGTTTQAAAASASKASSPTFGYIGRYFAVEARRIYKAVFFGSNDAGFIAGANPEITLELRGSNTLPGDYSADGTALGTLTFNDTADESAGREIVSSDQASTYQYVWGTITTGSGTAIHIAELQLFESLANPLTTLYQHGDTWLSWPGLVHAAPGPVAQDRLYYTGDGVPKMRVDSTVYPLAVPFPSAAPTATLDGVGSGDEQTRSYVYTFVTDFGEESEPSAVSNEVVWQPGYDVILSGLEAAPSGRNITKQRFYRTQSGEVGTDFYFIAERAASSSDFTDDVEVGAFAEALPSRYWNAPPDDLQGLIAMPNGMMAAFVDKVLYFCEPFRPHAWPEIYALTVDYPIVGLGALGTTLWVLTEGLPYRVSGTTPGGMAMEKVEANLPCVNARAIVDLGHSIAWPSTDGLAAARANGIAGLVSENLFTDRAWRRLNPGTMRGGQINGRWVGSYDALDNENNAISGSLIIDLEGEAFLIRTEVSAQAWFHDVSSGFLYFIPSGINEVHQFDPAGGNRANYYWRSKNFVLGKPDNFGCILVESGALISQDDIEAREAEIEAITAANEALIAAGSVGGDLAGEGLGVVPVGGDLLEPIPASAGTTVTVGVYANGELVHSIGVLDRPVRLPSGFTERIWWIDVFGDVTIDQITMAKTMDELKQAATGP